MDDLMNKDVINVVDYKHELDKLTGNILNEYMKLESMYLQVSHLKIGSFQLHHFHSVLKIFSSLI